ncbi:MAG: VCBS repeat-containing protein [Verrucomicrobia bacterium]|nr:VCBS repeat-containing protein [Verrucomicrobiota bacterium]
MKRTQNNTSQRDATLSNRLLRGAVLNVLLLVSTVGVLNSAAQQPSSGAATDQVLDEAKQKAIWDAEHVTFEIEWRFGKPFLEALKARDEKAAAKWFHKNFRGATISNPSEVQTRRKGEVVEISRGADSKSAADASVADVMAALLAQIKPVAEIERAGLRVLYINNEGGQKWSTSILLSASGKSGDGGLIAVDSKHQVVFEIEDDAEFVTGPCIATWKISSERQWTSPTQLMEEITSTSGLTLAPVVDNWKLPKGKVRRQFPSQLAVEDFDRDGFLDIAIATIDGPSALFRSVDGKQFKVVNVPFKVKPMSTRKMRSLATWIDFNNDGFPDLLLGDRVYRNDGGKSFADITAESGLKFPQHQMGAAVADYDGDGLLDLYILYQYSSETSPGDPGILPWVGDAISGAPNALWRNLGDGRFEDVTEKSGAGGGLHNSFAAVWLYADDDRHPDLYVANDFGKNNLLRNRGDGTFEDISAQSGVADFATSMGVAAGDIDNDGRTEIYVANMYSKMGRRIIAHVGEADYAAGIYEQIKGACAGNRLYKRDAKGGYSEWSESWGINDVGWAYAPAIADLDNDGLLDIYATTGFMSFDRNKPDG